MDELSQDAETIVSVNTVILREGRLLGHNTDWYGFSRALDVEGYEPEGKIALVLGAGGAARAIVYALLLMGVSNLYVRNRTLERSLNIVRDLQKVNDGSKIIALKRDEGTPEGISLVVSALASGVVKSANDLELPENLELYYDVNYFKEEISVVNDLREKGFRASDGMGMLVHQGFRSLSLWLGEELNDDGITYEVLQNLREGSQ